MRRGFQPFWLTSRLRCLIPSGHLPITEGRIHFIRKVDGQGTVAMLNETWSIGKRWMGEYVWAMVDTAAQTLTFWQLADARAEWRRLKIYRFELKEPVEPLRLEFHRNGERCREQLPG